MKFFNIKRFTSLSQGRFWNYFRYAIGEIILVVIGILIAIQINTRYNAEIVDHQNKKILHNLLDDLAKDTNRLERLIKIDTAELVSLEKAVRNCDLLIQLSMKDLNNTNIDSLFNLPFFAGASIFSIEKAVYKQLENTGRLYSIGSDSIRNKIQTYYTNVEKEEYYGEINNKQLRASMLELDFFFKLNVKRFMGLFNPEIDNWIFDRRSEQMHEFRYQIILIRQAQSMNINRIQNLKKEAKELIIAINRELELDS